MGMDLTVYLEMADGPIYSVVGGTNPYDPVARDLVSTRFALDPSNYDGATYFFEIVGNWNESTSPLATFVVELRDHLNATVASIQVARGVDHTQSVRVRSTAFVPVADTYHVYKPAMTSGTRVDIYAARIVVDQVNATKTKIQIPLTCNTTTTGTTNGEVDSTISSSYGQNYPDIFNFYTKHASEFAGDSVAWSFETLHGVGGGAGGHSLVSLFTSAGSQIASSEVSTANTNLDPVIQEVSLSNVNFPDGMTVQVEHKKTAT